MGTCQYTAPVSKVLTVVHIRDGDVTACGEPVDGDWLDVVLRPGERICPACQGHASTQETLL